VNKGVIIGIIVAVIIVGAIALAQDGNETDTTTIITETDNGETKPKSFEVDLQESVGMAEKP
jgi:hypothetical protein